MSFHKIVPVKPAHKSAKPAGRHTPAPAKKAKPGRKANHRRPVGNKKGC